MAARDEIIAYAGELLDLAAHPDYGPMGLQVVGAPEVTKIAAGVSASRSLFEQARGARAQLLVVHHGLFWNAESPIVDAPMRARLEALFAGNITLAAYHLALDAHPEIGNNVLLAHRLGVDVEGPFEKYGAQGRLREPLAIDRFSERVRRELGREPLVFAHGPDRIERVAVVTGGGGRLLPDAARAGFDLFLTGEPEEPSLHAALELGIHFVAAGHYATETLGVQALAARLAERFALEWEFLDLPNPV